MIQRKTVIEQPELHRSGILQVKIALLLVEGDSEIACDWHRTAVGLDEDAQEKMDAINQDLISRDPPIPPVSQSDIDFIKACHELQKSRFPA